ncbi:MAG: hypothetical protein IJ042_07370 [Butyricicoccus sp.]|nr:hypothetical protein [Butyricicoccus sp.]
MSEYINYNTLRVVEIAPENIRRIQIVQLGKQTMGQWYAAQTDKPKYMLNASLWDTKGPIGTIILDGEMTRNEGNGFGIGTTDRTGFAFASRGIPSGWTTSPAIRRSSSTASRPS